VKTRLSPPLAPEEAALLYRAFLLDALDLYATLRPAVEPVLYLADGDDIDAMRELIGEMKSAGEGSGMEIRIQRGSTLGERLHNAFADAFRNGCDMACAIGTDHPTLPLDYIRHAFDAIADHDIAIGPADDGGYYLLALREPNEAIFRDMPYSTASLFDATLSRASSLGMRVATLPLWYDVDDRESFIRLVDDSALLPPGSRTGALLHDFEERVRAIRGE
jgi:rSAM/selenodomain-associated transferase 1